ncbi:MAG: transglutaminaseTgpA domain-containing protein, partial [Myxococcota bacterium]
VRLGGHGTIKTDSTVVMRIEVAEPWQGREARNIHWRGVAFDRYKDGQWVRSNQAPRTRRHMTYSDAGEEQHHLLYDRPTPGPGVLEERTARAMRQEIYLEPIGYDVLFGASMPLAIEFESKLGMRSPRTERNDEMRFSHAAGVKYVVYSKLEPPEPQRLRAAETILPDSYRVYLQVPDEITDEVRNLAHEITRDAPTHNDKAVAVERWLESNLDYTLEMRDPGELEPLHFFLFDRQMGHCEYFASAMAILLREVGVPTRNVNGFLGGEWNEYNNYIAVRAGDAHSWVEVYFHGMGWVTFDPTPAAEVDQLGRGGLSLQDRMRRLIDTMRFRWFKWVIEYDLYRQMSLFRDLRDSVRGSAGSVRDQLGAVKDRVSEYKKPILIGIGVIGVAIFGFLWLRRRRYQLPGGLSRAKRQRTPISALYSAVLTRLAKRGHRRAPATTPREYARALAEADVPGAGAFGELTEIYYRSMYREDGGHSELAAARRLSEAIEDAFRTAKRAAATDARSA